MVHIKNILKKKEIQSCAKTEGLRFFMFGIMYTQEPFK